MTLKRIMCLLITAVLSIMCITACSFTPGGDNGGGSSTAKTIVDLSFVEGSIPTEITVGDTLDTSKIKVKAVYSDNSEVTLSESDLTLGRIESGVAGVHKLSIEYAGFKIYVDITVKPAAVAPAEPTVKSVSNIIGVNTSLSLGDTFDTSNIKATVTYSNGTTKVVGIADGLVVGGDTVNTSKGGVYYITVSYGGVVASNPIAVAVSSELVGIEFDPSSFNTTLYHNQEIDASGIAVYEVYEDGTKKPITLTDNLVIDVAAIKTDSVGEGSFGITYTKEGSEFSVNVPYIVLRDLLYITIEKAPVSVMLGGTISAKDISVFATYSDNVDEPAALGAEDFTISRVDTSVVGEKTVTVAFQNKTAEFKLSVLPKLLSVAYCGDDLVFRHAPGSDIDPENTLEKFESYINEGKVKLKLTYDLGAGEHKVEYVTLNSESVYEIDGLDASLVGTHYMDIKYNGFAANTGYTVIRYLASLSLADSNTFRRVAHNADANSALANLKLQAVYSNGEREDIELDAVTIEGFTTDTVVANAELTVSYENASLAVPYEIYRIFASLVFDDDTYTTAYRPGQPKTAQNTVNAKCIYSDGTFEIVTASVEDFELDTTAQGAATIVNIKAQCDGEDVYGSFKVEVLTVKELVISGIKNNVPYLIEATDLPENYVETLIGMENISVTAILKSGSGKLTEYQLSSSEFTASHDIVITEKGDYKVYADAGIYGIAEATVTAGLKLTEIEIISFANEYFQYGKIDLSSLVIKATYHDGTECELLFKDIEEDISYTGFDTNEVNYSDGFTIIITYTENGFAASDDATYFVYDAVDDYTFEFDYDSVEITVGEEFVLNEHGTFTVNGNDVTSETEFRCTCGYMKDGAKPRPGTYTVTVSYKGLQATLNLRVVAATTEGGGDNVTDKT